MTGNKNVKLLRFQYQTIICWKEFYHKKFRSEIGKSMAYQQILYRLIMVFLFSTVEDGH